VLRVGRIQGEGFIFLVIKKKLLSASNTLAIVENRLEMKKLQPSKVKALKTQKNNP
jgi:hypothetical protein